MKIMAVHGLSAADVAAKTGLKRSWVNTFLRKASKFKRRGRCYKKIVGWMASQPSEKPATKLGPNLFEPAEIHEITRRPRFVVLEYETGKVVDMIFSA
jgi:hypothetical protein